MDPLGCDRTGVRALCVEVLVCLRFGRRAPCGVGVFSWGGFSGVVGLVGCWGGAAGQSGDGWQVKGGSGGGVEDV